MTRPTRSRDRGRTAATADAATSPRRALVVESESATAVLISAELQVLGFVTETVSAAVEAVIAARRATPSLIVLALQLHDAYGPQLLVWLRANPELKTVPVLAIQAASDDAARLGQEGFAAVLKKPLSAEKIREAVSAVIPVTV